MGSKSRLTISIIHPFAQVIVVTIADENVVFVAAVILHAFVNLLAGWRFEWML
ncbi:MAG: hypothetical protein WD824_20020 [Cyclobacteriaceae bacterium]